MVIDYKIHLHSLKIVEKGIATSLEAQCSYDILKWIIYLIFNYEFMLLLATMQEHKINKYASIGMYGNSKCKERAS